MILERTEKKEAQIYEALLRMKKMGLHKNCIDDFIKRKKINKSVYCKLGHCFFGKLVWLEEEIKRVKEFEERYDCTVYHIIESNTEFGRLLSYFYVGKDVEMWEIDNQMIYDGLQFVYVDNLDIEEYSEFGSIGFKQVCGGLIRTQ